MFYLQVEMYSAVQIDIIEITDTPASMTNP